MLIDKSNICMDEQNPKEDDYKFVLPNSIAVNMSNYLGNMLYSIEGQIKTLNTTISSENYQSVIKDSGRYAGRKPTIHAETGLIERISKTKYGKLIQQFPSPKPEQFDEQLEKAERLMTSMSKFKGSKRRLMRATYRTLKQCKFPNKKFNMVDAKTAAYEQLNRQASSGYPEFVRKGTILDLIIEGTTNLFKGDYKHVFKWPTTRGFRIQFRQSLNEVAMKIRVMYPYPAVITLLEVMFIIPFVKHFIITDTFYVIGANGLSISRKLRSRLGGKDVDKILATDISSFDQNMPNEPIVLAFWILKQQLSLTDIESKLFDEMVLYYCTSILVSKSKGKPAYAFVKTHGIASGSGFTNMIGTLAHAIILEYYHIGILERALLCGDDNIINVTGIDHNLLLLIFENCFGLPVNREKTKLFTSCNEIEFLGFTWKFFVRMVSPRLVINQLIWHTDFRTDLDKFERELARSASILLNGQNGKAIFATIFPDVMKLLEMGIDVRFTYLYGTSPPTTAKSVVGLQENVNEDIKPDSDQSLREHLADGWKIR